jgi:hypothetical protein
MLAEHVMHNACRKGPPRMEPGANQPPPSVGQSAGGQRRINAEMGTCTGEAGAGASRAGSVKGAAATSWLWRWRHQHDRALDFPA